MTHVWQAQKNALFSLKEIFKKHRNYEYELTENTDFLKDLEVEQQAQVVGEYYLFFHEYSKHAGLLLTQLYYTTVSQVFPVSVNTEFKIIFYEYETEDPEEEKK